MFSVFLLGISCKKEPTLFTEVSSGHSGITFTNQLNDSPELNILNYLYYYNGAGVAAVDFNNDGLTDLYFTGNQVADALYLNKGGFQFENITNAAGISNAEGWTTGVTHVDINGDGWKDIYVCKASGYRTLQGKNLLYLNQGPNDQGIPQFKEVAADFGLDFSGLSTQAAFFDYDLDGDLDMFHFNHSVHPNSNYGKGVKRKRYDPLSGDVLFENQNGQYIDISEKAGIFQGKIGYGLGVSVGDVNNDGYPDLYVGNDFFENDYLYINQQDGTFIDIISTRPESLGHTTHYSMGNGMADINNDGALDMVSLDMLPEELASFKTSGVEFAYPIYQNYLKNGYAPQYMQNTLHLNLGNTQFAEVSNLSGISATEWSWGVLSADFDNDGYKDLFISNGIKGATNDMDFVNFIANDNIQQRIDAGMSTEDMPLIEELPQKKTTNYIFKNNGDLTFADMTAPWIGKRPSFSNGCVYADLDNDGDLDLVVNNVDQVATVLQNNTTGGHYLKLRLKGSSDNPVTLGTKIYAYAGDEVLFEQVSHTTGYLSAVSDEVHFGIGDKAIDSLAIIWPNGHRKSIKDPKIDQVLELTKNDAMATPFQGRMAAEVPNDSLYSFVHRDASSLDFDREPLVPFAYSNEGPNISVADINQDGLDDFFIGGAKTQASGLFVQQTDGTFKSVQDELFNRDAINEDTGHTFFDADNDGDLDLLVTSGGNEFKKGKALKPRLYINNGGRLERDSVQFEGVALNASKVLALDFDQDGDEDLIMTADAVPHEFGVSARQYVFDNNGSGSFIDTTHSIAPEFEYLGNVKDVVSVDLDGNGFDDLIVVGHWMPISIFLYNGQGFELQTTNGLEKSNGWWNCVRADDFDGDGDLDFVVGNWGLNTKFKASETEPITLYRNDFDNNGSIEPLVTYFYQGEETSFASKDELSKQMPYLNKKFLSYASFSKAGLTELFDPEDLKSADRKMVFELNSSRIMNNGDGTFTTIPLPKICQSSSVRAVMPHDFNKDGYNDLLIMGNDYEISTQLGRLDALHGIVLLNDGDGNMVWAENYGPLVSGAVRDIEKIKLNGTDQFLVARNNETPIILANPIPKQ